jgi:uncharacterized low-complexity protein
MGDDQKGREKRESVAGEGKCGEERESVAREGKCGEERESVARQGTRKWEEWGCGNSPQ